MAKLGKVTWNEKALRLQVRDLSIAEIDKIALEIIAVSDPPIDTGFLDASAYVNSSSGLNTFDETWDDGEFVSRHTGQLVERSKAESPVAPPKNGAVAAWAANHAIYIEEETSFIYQAVQEVASSNR